MRLGEEGGGLMDVVAVMLEVERATGGAVLPFESQMSGGAVGG